MKLNMPENPTHNDLWGRVEASEERIIGVMKWTVGILAPLLTVVVGWGITSARAQEQLNRDAAEQFGRATAMLESLGQKQQALEDKLERHFDNPRAHHNISAGG